MRALCSLALIFLLTQVVSAQGAVDFRMTRGASVQGTVEPIPESQQAALALKILTAYHAGQAATAPAKLHVVYFTPSDRDPEPRYRERLQAIMEDIQSFYRDGMERAGFGPETFDLAKDADGKLVIHLVKSKSPENEFKRSGFSQDASEDERAREIIKRESDAVLKAAGIDLEHETVIIFCNLAKWDEAAKKFSHHSPYCGIWSQNSGICYAVDSVILNAADLAKKKPVLHDREWGDESLGKFNTVFIGGVAHELGHALTLPHCGERADQKALGKSLMGIGNHTYRDELRGEGPGAFLALASAMKLAGHPLFNKWDFEATRKPKLQQCELNISTNVTRADLLRRPHALRLDGQVDGQPPVYGVIAYFDSTRTGGYDAPTATAVPDSEGRFAIEIGDLKPTRKGQLIVQFCHANGGISEWHGSLKLLSDSPADLAQVEIRSALAPLIRSVTHNDEKTAQAELKKIEQGAAPELAKKIARKLTASLNGEPKLTPAEVPAGVAELALGDAKWDSAKVGWFQPAANRIPPNDETDSPLLDCGEYYATGLFAHAPSQYVFKLDGKWKKLRGKGGLDTDQQPYGSVDFSIKADGKEIYRSATIRGSKQAAYDVDVRNVKRLELIVGDGGNGNGNDWGLWLEPTLSR